MQTVLVAESDDQTLIERGDELLLDGYDVLAARTEGHCRLRLADGAPDAVVLGTLEHPAQALAVLRDLRAGQIAGADPRVAVISLGADSDHGAVRHYQAGADIALPASASAILIKGALEALAARTGEHQRRRQLRVGSLTVDCDARVASIAGEPVALTRLEFDLLQMLAGQPRRTFTKAELTKQVWGYDPAAAGPSRTLDSHAHRLRHKLGAAGPDALVQTVPGVGYRLTR